MAHPWRLLALLAVVPWVFVNAAGMYWLAERLLDRDKWWTLPLWMALAWPWLMAVVIGMVVWFPVVLTWAGAG